MQNSAFQDPDWLHKAFSDPVAVATYSEGVRRYVPGVEALHRMTAVLIGERAPADARILVLGAGGGMEMKALAQAEAGWRFVGVDPSAEMLKLAGGTLGPYVQRAELVEGTIDAAPEGPFDAAVALLVLHFLDFDERRRTVEEIRRRLKPGAPLVAAHNTLPQNADARAKEMSRYRDYAVASGADREEADRRRAAVEAFPNMLPPERDEEILRNAGFQDVGLFFAAFSWRGWVGYR